MKSSRFVFPLLFCALALGVAAAPIRCILDTDANNEVDDQQAIAYMLFNPNVFDVEGITVNRTRHGGTIDDQAAEAVRVVKLCEVQSRVHIYKGASGSFDQIAPHVSQPDFDGAAAVNFIIKCALAPHKRQLTIFEIGKITNIALALYKEPAIASRIRVYWGAGNFPSPGGYNWSADLSAVRHVMESPVQIDLVPARYRKPSGSDAVRMTVAEVRRHIAGRGPMLAAPIVGRNGEKVRCFGDYSVSLLEHYRPKNQPNWSKALFDVVDLAVAKNPAWGEHHRTPRYTVINRRWVPQPQRPGYMVVWENFNRNAIIDDFFVSVVRAGKEHRGLNAERHARPQSLEIRVGSAR